MAIGSLGTGSITSMGIGSGLDIKSLVSQILAAERAPTQRRLDRKEADFTSQLSAFGALKGALAGFQGAVKDLSNIASFQKLKVSSSDSAIVSATADSTAKAGSYDVKVNQLAQAQTVASGAFSDINAVVGYGTLTFKFGTVTTANADGTGNVTGFTQNTKVGTKTVTLSASQNTLGGIRDAINEADIGVTASIINDGSGYRLSLVASDTGAAQGFTVEATDSSDASNTDAAGLSQLAFNASATNVSRTRVAQDALLSVNGLAITRESNTVSDAIAGVTLSLKKVATDTSVSLTVSRDNTAVTANVNKFISAYNDLQKQINDLTRYDVEAKKASILTGDAITRGVSTALRRIMNDVVEGLTGDIQSLADIGIKTKSDGTLELDSGKLTKALEDNFDDVGALFAPLGRASDSGVSFEGYSSASDAGRYGVVITTAASQGFRNGDAVLPDFAGGGTLTVDSSNDQFQVIVDGTTSRSISLTQKTYTSGEELAAEIQSQINGDQNLRDQGYSVAVTYQSGSNRLVITSSSYGDESTVEILSPEAGAAATLGLSAGAGTAGTDVAGTIGGHAAEGDGRYLTGTAGAANGLKIKVTGDTLGDRGSVKFSLGLMGALNQQLESILDSDGVIEGKLTGLKKELDTVAKGREDLARRLQQLELRYTNQFIAMDALVSKMNETQGFLRGQLTNLENLARQAGS